MFKEDDDDGHESTVWCIDFGASGDRLDGSISFCLMWHFFQPLAVQIKQLNFGRDINQEIQKV